MSKVNRRRSHSRHAYSRRSIESITSNETETFSSEEEEEILINPNADIDFSNESVLNDISDLFSFCKEQINTRFTSVLIYISLRHFSHSWRGVESFLTSIGGMTIKTRHTWTNILVNKDIDEFTIEESVRVVLTG
ncbi:unnamed protein product [Rotaria socialis]|uniref:Uncharacterized protein n=1 Tax=Rotaria socialis TaxID=392032 RepID=A0A818XIU1_9BILA|nr:unnamed protein product [Rotaria socialis]